MHTEMTDSNGYSPLAIAIENGMIEVERYLRDNGCTVDGDNQWLLFAACKHGRQELIKELVEVHDCDPSSKHYGTACMSAFVIDIRLISQATPLHVDLMNILIIC